MKTIFEHAEFQAELNQLEQLESALDDARAEESSLLARMDVPSPASAPTAV